MTFVPFANVAQVGMEFLEFDQKLANVYHVMKDAPWTASELQDLAALFKTWHNTDIKPTQSSSVGLYLIIARSLESDSAPSIEYNTGLPIVGTNVSTPGLPGNVTVSVKWTTGLRGRSYRGRTYHIGLCEDMVSGNKVNESVVNALVTAYMNLLTALFLEDWSLVVASRQHNNVKLTTGVATPIIQATVEEYVDSQRRRLTGRGQ